MSVVMSKSGDVEHAKRLLVTGDPSGAFNLLVKADANVDVLRNICHACYDLGDYASSVAYGEAALSLSPSGKERDRVVLRLVMAYFAMIPTREKYDRMGCLLATAGHKLEKYKLAVGFRLEQRDKDVVVEHERAGRHCLRFYFTQDDFPLHLPRFQADTQVGGKAVAVEFRKVPVVKSALVFASRTYSCVEMLSYIFILAQNRTPDVVFRSHDVASIADIFLVLTLIDQTRTNQVGSGKIHETLLHLICTPYIPLSCQEVLSTTLRWLVEQEACPYQWAQFSPDDWNAIRKEYQHWNQGHGNFLRQDRYTPTNITTFESSMSNENDTTYWLNWIDKASAEQLSLLNNTSSSKPQNKLPIRKKRGLLKLRVSEASVEELQRLKELKSVAVLTGTENDWFRLKEVGALTEDIDGAWRNVFRSEFVNPLDKLLELWELTESSTSHPMDALGYVSAALTSLSKSPLFSTTDTRIQFLTKSTQRKAKHKTIQFDLLAISITDDPTVILSNLPIAGLVYTSRHLKSKAAEAALGLKVVSDECNVLYRYEPVATYKEFGIVKDWLVQFYKNLLNTECTYSLCSLLSLLSRIYSNKYPRHMVSGVLDELVSCIETEKRWKCFATEVLSQIALWLPKVNANFCLSYMLFSVYEMAKYAVHFKVVEGAQGPFFMVLLPTSEVKMMELKRHFTTDMYLFTVIRWHTQTSVAEFCLPQPLYNDLEKQKSRCFVLCQQWKTISTPVSLSLATRVEF